MDTLYTVGFREVSGLKSFHVLFDFNTSTIMKIVIFTVIVLRGSMVRIIWLQEFLKSDHWLQRYCILSGGVFYFEPPCILGERLSV